VAGEDALQARSPAQRARNILAKRSRDGVAIKERFKSNSHSARALAPPRDFCASYIPPKAV